MFGHAIRGGLMLGIAAALLHADSDSTTGRITDPSDRVVVGAQIVVLNSVTLGERAVTINSEGIFEISALPAGNYRMQAKAPGFRLYTVETLTTEVARTINVEVRLELGDVSEEVTVTSQSAVIDSATTSVGHGIDGRMVQKVPLNGRYFLDLALLAPGSVTASQNRFSTTPSRGLGVLAINTAGNREKTVNYRMNGITLNDLVFSSILYQPSISVFRNLRSIIQRSARNTEEAREPLSTWLHARARANFTGNSSNSFATTRWMPAFFQFHLQSPAALQTQPIRREPRRTYG
jgi:hypothetical protein